MQTIPDDILKQYLAVLKKRAVPVFRYADYRKWLRYFLDWKLQEKKQSPEQQKQAAHALSLFFQSLDAKTKAAGESSNNIMRSEETKVVSSPGRVDLKASVSQVSSHPFAPPVSSQSHYNEWHCLKKSASPGWDKIIETLAAEIKVRHYSRKTLKAYAD